MSRIIFHKIQFQNFMSYGNYETTLDLDKDKLTLIQGDNGAGKTTALLALAYNLFGKTFNKAAKSSLINKKNKKGLLTRCWFSIGDNEYFIERGDKPAIFNVVVNGKPLDINGDSRDFQKKLETEILQFDLKTFTRLICLGYNYIRFFELSTIERREFIESVLDLNVLSDMTKKVKEYHKQDSDDLIKYNLLLNGKISNKEIYESQFAKLSESNEQQIKDYEIKINDLINQNNKIKTEILQEKSNYDNINTNIQNIKKDIETDNLKLTELQKKIYNIENIINGNSDLKKFLNSNDKCPTCHQNINKEYSNHVIDELNKQDNKLKTQLDSLNGEKNSIKIILDNNNKDVNELNKQLQEKINIITKQKTIYKSNDVNITEYSKNIEKLKNNADTQELKNNIQKTLKDINEFESKISKLNLRLEIYKETLNILSDTGVKKALIDNYIDIIINKVNEYLEAFDCTFDFVMDSEFNETINLDFHDEVKYENLSAGQKQRLDLSIFLAFREIAQLRSKTSTNILLMDEILDQNLDEDGVCKIIDILLKQNNINIIAISHNANCKEMFENVITVKKEKYGFSRMYK